MAIVSGKLASFQMTSGRTGCGEVTRLDPCRAFRGLPDGVQGLLCCWYTVFAMGYLKWTVPSVLFWSLGFRLYFALPYGLSGKFRSAQNDVFRGYMAPTEAYLSDATAAVPASKASSTHL